jgi:hypothetical protein
MVMEMQFVGTESIYGISQFAITCVLFSSHIKQKVKKKYTRNNREEHDLEHLVE